MGSCQYMYTCLTLCSRVVINCNTLLQNTHFLYTVHLRLFNGSKNKQRLFQ
jgi:hypothetical protein